MEALNYKLEVGDVVLKETFADGSIQIKVSYMHGDADGDTEETYTLLDTNPVIVGKTVEALRFLSMSDDQHGTRRELRKALTPTLMQILNTDKEGVEHFLESYMVSDMHYGDGEFWASIQDFQVTIWQNGIEHELNVFKGHLPLNI